MAAAFTILEVMLAAVGAVRRGSTSVITLHGAGSTGSFSFAELPESLPALALPRPAVLATGSPGQFLVVWEAEPAAGQGTIQGTLVQCGP